MHAKPQLSYEIPLVPLNLKMPYFVGHVNNVIIYYGKKKELICHVVKT